MYVKKITKGVIMTELEKIRRDSKKYYLDWLDFYLGKVKNKFEKK